MSVEARVDAHGSAAGSSASATTRGWWRLRAGCTTRRSYRRSAIGILEMGPSRAESSSRRATYRSIHAADAGPRPRSRTAAGARGDFRGRSNSRQGARHPIIASDSQPRPKPRRESTAVSDLRESGGSSGRRRVIFFPRGMYAQEAEHGRGRRRRRDIVEAAERQRGRRGWFLKQFTRFENSGGIPTSGRPDL